MRAGLEGEADHAALCVEIERSGFGKKRRQDREDSFGLIVLQRCAWDRENSGTGFRRGGVQRGVRHFVYWMLKESVRGGPRRARTVLPLT